MQQLEIEEGKTTSSIPAGWKSYKINELGKIITGSTPLTSSKRYYGSEYPWATPVDLGNLKYIEHTQTMLSSKGFETTRKIPKYSVLIVCIGSIGKVGIAAKDMATNQQINSRICNQNFDSEFIYYQLLFNESKIRNSSNQLVIPIINKTDFGNMKLRVPSSKIEQNKIAQILSNLDELIQRTDDVIKQTQSLKNGLIQKLMTKGIKHTKFKKTRIGDIPDSWNLSITSDIFPYVTSGSRDWAKYYSDSGPILIRITNLDHDSIDLDLREIKHVSLPQGVEGTRTRVKPNDIVISITADVGMVAVIPASLPEAYVNQHIALIRLKEGYEARFLARYISWKEGGLKQLIQMQRGVTKVGLGLSDVKNITVPIPTQNEQQKIVSILDSVESALAINYQYKKMTERIKLGLMQQLLTGRKRVKV